MHRLEKAGAVLRWGRMGSPPLYQPHRRGARRVLPDIPQIPVPTPAIVSLLGLRRNSPGYGYAISRSQRSPCGSRSEVKRNGGRLRKTTIVALARKLLVALWKYVTAGVGIEGTAMKTA